jgi:hypothetical protein
MKRTFFEAVSIANMERMHSQMIAWIFSPDCEAISHERKHQLIADLSLSSGVASRGAIDTHTEWNHIDIVIETETSVIFIENKIKSSQGSRQLERYNAVISGPKGEALLKRRSSTSRRRPAKVLLSLVGEEPEADGWTGLDYCKMVERLSKALSSSAGGGEDATIVGAYVRSLARLTDVVEAFRISPERFRNVFEDGGRSLAEKLNMPRLTDEDGQYVRDMQLETVLQRLYLSRIARLIVPGESIVIVGETRGTALLDIKQPAGLRSIRAGKHEFDWGIQFQGESVKIQLESGWKNQSEKKPVRPGMRKLMEKEIIPAVAAFVARPEIANGWQFNRPKKDSGTAYCSLSRQRPSGDPLYWGESWDEAVEGYRAQLASARDLAGGLQRHIETAMGEDFSG